MFLTLTPLFTVCNETPGRNVYLHLHRVRKCLNLRVFDDNGERWKTSVKDKDLEVLCVSQVCILHLVAIYLFLLFYCNF